MPKLTGYMARISAAAIISTFCGTLAMAQDASTDESAQTDTQNGLALGEPVDETRQPGDTYVRETIGDWAIRCVVVPDADDRCQLYQLLADENQQPIAEFTVIKLREGGQAEAAATIIVPLETSLQNQLLIRVDEETGKRYPFAFCNSVGCFARIGLVEDDVDLYRRGSQAMLTIVPIAAPDAEVSVRVSLSGFTAAFEQLEPAG
ncbi:MAG: invasion associated locus B family protein [Roseobacter sp.]